MNFPCLATAILISTLIMFGQLQTILCIVMNSFKQKTSLLYNLSSLGMGVICECGLCVAVYCNKVSTAKSLLIYSAV